MTYNNTTGTQSGTGTYAQGKTFQASDIRALIQKHGTVVFGNQEFTLQTPATTDSNLQAIVSQPSFAVKPLGHSNGYAEYELSASGKKSVTIRVGSKTIN